MKNRILCVLSIMVLFFAATPAHAGFIMKKQATVQITATAAATELNTVTAQQTAELQKISARLDKMTSPSSVFVRWMATGTIGLFALLFGILGFLAPVFSIGAVLFGFLGMKRFCNSRGLAIIGFVLGIAVICMAAFGGYAPAF